MFCGILARTEVIGGFLTYSNDNRRSLIAFYIARYGEEKICGVVENILD